MEDFKKLTEKQQEQILSVIETLKNNGFYELLCEFDSYCNYSYDGAIELSVYNLSEDEYNSKIVSVFKRYKINIFNEYASGKILQDMFIKNVKKINKNPYLVEKYLTEIFSGILNKLENKEELEVFVCNMKNIYNIDEEEILKDIKKQKILLKECKTKLRKLMKTNVVKNNVIKTQK